MTILVIELLGRQTESPGFAAVVSDVDVSQRLRSVASIGAVFYDFCLEFGRSKLDWVRREAGNHRFFLHLILKDEMLEAFATSDFPIVVGTFHVKGQIVTARVCSVYG